MTRTERATSPRAIIKDRSESKTGINKHTPKNGAGTHNWGSLMDERELEEAATLDGDSEETGAARPPEPPRRKSSPSSPTLADEERGHAREFRKNALKSPDLDLGAIARTSAAVSTSGPQDTVAVLSDADTLDHA